MAVNSTVNGSIRLNFKLSPDCVVVLVTCKNKEDSKIMELEFIQHNSLIFQLFKAANLVVCGGILPKLKLIKSLMHVLVTCKNEKDIIKMKALECSPIICL